MPAGGPAQGRRRALREILLAVGHSPESQRGPLCPALPKPQRPRERAARRGGPEMCRLRFESQAGPHAQLTPRVEDFERPAHGSALPAGRLIGPAPGSHQGSGRCLAGAGRRPTGQALPRTGVLGIRREPRADDMRAGRWLTSCVTGHDTVGATA